MKITIYKKDKLINVSILLLLIFIACLACNRNNLKNVRSTDGKDILVEKKQYVCSMHPQVLQDRPGDCPICGMALIEKIASDKNKPDSLLNDVVRPVNESVLGNLATVCPVQAELPIVVEASGIVNYDPRKIRTISARFGGLIERSFIKYQFQPVKKGQKIYEIYCPDIYTTHWNYIKLIQMYPDKDELTVEARNWLTLLGLTEGQIDSLKRAVIPDYHLPVYSEVEGYAISSDFDPESYFSVGREKESKAITGISSGDPLGFNEGIATESGTPIFKVVDANSIRIDLKVSTIDIGLIKKGQNVNISLVSSPETKIKGTVDLIEPLNDDLFQKVRVYLNGNDDLLLPGRQVQASIFTGNHKTLWIPKTAVIDLGHRHSVFLMQENKFVATNVKTGLRTADKIEILSGIDQNSKIALKALLLTDSDGFISSANEDDLSPVSR